MENYLKSLLVAGTLAASASLVAQTAPAIQPATPTPESAATAPEGGDSALQTIEQNGQKFILVSTIKTIEANREFQNNVNVVQAQRKLAIDLQTRINQALTTPEKEALQKKLDEVVEKLEANNILMAKTYGFSLTRSYLVQVAKTRLYTPLTDEEYGKLTDEQKSKPDAVMEVSGKDKDGKPVTNRFLYIAGINSVAENDIFRQNVQLVQTQRNRVGQLTEALKQVSNEGDKKKLEEELQTSEETLLKNNKAMEERYGFSLARNYVMEVEESRLYTSVTDEELKKTEAAQAGAIGQL